MPSLVVIVSLASLQFVRRPTPVHRNTLGWGVNCPGAARWQSVLGCGRSRM